MNSIRTTLFGFAVSAALAGLTHAAPVSFAPQDQVRDQACQCTCAACVAKHGTKAADAPAPVVLPGLPVDIEVEVAKILSSEVASAEAAQALAAIGYAGEPLERGYMGISLDREMGDLGAVIATVAPNSPAEKAGLLPGDVIVVAEEMPVESSEELIAALIDLKVGETVTLELEREGDERVVSMTLESMGALAAPARVVLEVPIVLPAEIPVLHALGYLGAEEEEEEDEEEASHVLRQVVELERIEVNDHHVDPLPEGYIEIETRRERRPAINAALRERVERLEAEVAELARIVAKLRAELDRRNPR